MSFIIAPLKQEHAQGLWEAVDSVAREKKYLAFLQAPPLASTVEFIDNKLKNNIPSFVAIVEERVVGWCDLRTIPRPIFSHVMEVGIGVVAPFRRMGMGRALMEQAIKTAQEQGYTRLELSVRASNSAAIELYKKLGFELEGVKRSHACVDGFYEDVLWMAKLFEAS